jgi:hypothetical protein
MTLFRPSANQPGKTTRILLAFLATLALLAGGCSGGVSPTPTGLPVATTSPSPSPTKAYSYPPLTLSIDCSTFEVIGAFAPDLGFQLAAKADFSDAVPVFGYLDASTFTLTIKYQPGDFPDGIYIRWAADPSVGTHAYIPSSCPTPKPKVTPNPITEGALKEVCKGTPVPAADPYGGTVHPLVLVTAMPAAGMWDLYKTLFDIDAKWYDNEWPGPIQLVVCVGYSQLVKVDSCGTYTRQSDGARGQMIRYKRSSTVRVVVAQTGKDLQSKVFYGPVPACAKTLSNVDNPDGAPPWKISGYDADSGAINAWAVSVSTQVVK